MGVPGVMRHITLSRVRALDSVSQPDDRFSTDSEVDKDAARYVQSLIDEIRWRAEVFPALRLPALQRVSVELSRVHLVADVLEALDCADF